MYTMRAFETSAKESYCVNFWRTYGCTAALRKEDTEYTSIHQLFSFRSCWRRLDGLSGAIVGCIAATFPAI